MNKQIADIRNEYARHTLSKKDVQADPMKQFNIWFEEALQSELPEPTAMTLSTADRTYRATSRIVLMKDIREDGLVFYTNYNSRKGQQLQENPLASLLFFWPELERQIRFEGKVEKLSPETSDAYFASRPRGSKIGAWASDQSSEIPSRTFLEQRSKELENQFDSNSIPRPAHWGGYILKPETVEFWQGRPSRLHDRIQYSLENDKWIIRRLAP